MSCQTNRQDRLAAGQAWDRAFAPHYSQAVAQALVGVLRAIKDPKVSDLLQFVREDLYDVTAPDRVEVSIAELLGLEDEGPTVAAVVDAISGLDSNELDIAVSRRLFDLLG